MREATPEFEYYATLLEYSKAILNAETEEEALAIREQIPEMLSKEFGYGEVAIEQFMTRLDNFVEQFENDDEIDIVEMIRLTHAVVSGEITAEEANDMLNEHGETETLTESAPEVNQLNYGAIGIGIGLFIGCYALKKKVLKNKKSKGL